MMMMTFIAQIPLTSLLNTRKGEEIEKKTHDAKSFTITQS